MIDKKLDELIKLLDNYPDIRKVKALTKHISTKELELINNYRMNPNIENKKKLYENETINDYLMCESRINYLIMQINSKFKRSHNCESNKW